MSSVCRILAAAGAVLLGSCSAGDAQPERAAAVPIAEPVGFYAGRFPCSNCDGIDARLWLRADGRFLLRQRYVGGDGGDDRPAYSFGNWRWDEASGRLVLSGVGPERRLRQLDRARLELETASPLPHRLAREQDPAPFTDSLRLEGESVVGASGITFTECITGLAIELAPGNGYQDLMRHHRRLNRNGPPALTEIDAHFEQVAVAEGETREVLVVDRFRNLKPRVGCGD